MMRRVREPFRELYMLHDRLKYWLEVFEDEIKKLERVSREVNDRLNLRGYWIDPRYVRGYGPYFCLRWIENGKLKAKYLGKNPDLKFLQLPEQEKKELEDRLKWVTERVIRLRDTAEHIQKLLGEVLGLSLIHI